MTITEYIKIRLKELDMTQQQLADKIGITKQNLNNKLSRDNFSSRELTEIAEALDAEIIIRTDSDDTKIEYNN